MTAQPENRARPETAPSSQTFAPDPARPTQPVPGSGAGPAPLPPTETAPPMGTTPDPGPTTRPTPGPPVPHNPARPRRTRLGGLWVVLTSGAVVLLILLIFIL